MHKLILWRICFDFWNLIAAILSYELFAFLRRFNPPVNYFTFGANLDPAVLHRRCTKPLAQEEFVLRDHGLKFSQKGMWKNFGFASVEAEPGEMVYGRILMLTKLDALRMDYSELVPFLQRHRRVKATQDGKSFYFYQGTRPRAGLMPSEEYLGKILQAAEQSDAIPAHILERLRATPTLKELEVDPDTNFLVPDYNVSPRFLAGSRRAYDQASVWLLRKLIFISLTQRLIKMEPEITS